MRRTRMVLAAGILLLAACDEGPTGGLVELSMPEQVLDAAGDSVQLEVFQGRKPLRASFVSLDPEIVTVSESGMARAQSAGTARIEAMVGRHSITGEVTVRPPTDVRIWMTELSPGEDGQEKLTLRIVNVGGRGAYRLEMYRRGEGGTAMPVRVDLNDNPAPVGMDVLFTTWLDVPTGAYHGADWVVVRSREANGTQLRPTECQLLYGAGYCVIP